MWVIANGAPKSGSTWIFQLLWRTKAFVDLPPRYQNEGWSAQSVDPSHVGACVRELGKNSDQFVTKQHWKNENAELMAEEGIKICNIIRDLRDVVVSRYHHDVRLGNFSGDLSSFLRKEAARYVNQSVTYHRYWITSDYVSPESYFITAYEYLSDDDVAAGNQLYDFLGGIDDETREGAIIESRFENKAKTGAGQFFRKGQAFGFADEMTAAEADAVLAHANELDFKAVKRKIADFNPALKPYLAQTDVGL